MRKWRPKKRVPGRAVTKEDTAEFKTVRDTFRVNLIEKLDDKFFVMLQSSAGDTPSNAGL